MVTTRILVYCAFNRRNGISESTLRPLERWEVTLGCDGTTSGGTKLGCGFASSQARLLLLAPRKLVWPMSVKTAVEVFPHLQVGEVM
jgi:hypothetical protein